MSTLQLQLIQDQLESLTRRMARIPAGTTCSNHQSELDSVSDQVSHILAGLSDLTHYSANQFCPSAQNCGTMTESLVQSHEHMSGAIGRDLSDKRRIEEEIRISEIQFRATFEQAAVGIAHVGTDGKWLRVNNKLCEMLGYSRDELLRLRFADVTHPDDKGIGPPELELLISGAMNSCVLEKRYIKKDGGIVWGTVTATVIRDAAGVPCYVASVIEDITERKQAEQALIKSLRILSTAEKVANMGSWEFDLRSNIISRSDELCRIIGVAESSQDASFARIVEMVHPDEREQMGALMGDAVRNRKAFVCKYRCIRPDAREIVLSVRGGPIQDVDGEVIRLVGSTQDITHQEAIDRILAQRSRMAALLADVGVAVTRYTNLKRMLKRCCEAIVHSLEATHVCIWSLNTQLSVLEIQSTAGISKRLCREPVSIEGTARICTIARERERCISNKLLAEPWLETAELVRGESIVSYAGFPLIVNDKLFGVLELFSRSAVSDVEIETLTAIADAITLGAQRRNAEDELRRVNLELEQRVAERTAQLEAAIAELDSFAYSASHDLRAPLRGIAGFSQALITEFDTRMPPRALQYLQRVRKSTDRMELLIERLIQLSCIGRKPLGISTVDLSCVLQDSVKQLRLTNADNDLEIVASDLPVCNCDPLLMQQVFANLLSNAVKYTRSCAEPKVKVEYQFEGDEHIFCVRDNGVGFEMQQMSKLFEPFQRAYQADDSDGSGVGLAIVRRIVTLHGGRVWADSKPGEGAAFYFALKPMKEHAY